MAGLAGWKRSFVDGGILLVPPDATAGRVRIQERVPAASLADLIARIRSALAPGLVADLERPPRPVATAEGEHAALFGLRIEGDGVVRQHDVGLVLGEEHFALIEGRVEHPALFATFRELVEKLTVGHSLGLGSDRWRRFFYQPPRGWQGYGRPRADLWLAPGYPRDAAVLTVFHARPIQASAATRQRVSLFEQLAGEVAAPTEPAHAVALPSGLCGDLWLREGVLGGRKRTVAEITLEAGKFQYPLRLETDAARVASDLDTFLEVIASARPLPTPPVHGEAVAPWSD